MKRFFTTWIIVAIVMFLMSYVWHGVILNDFNRLSYPEFTYLTLAAITYLVIGAVLTGLILLIESKKSDLLKGLLIGVVLGFFIYLIAFVLGVSFHSSPRIEHVLLDFAWQMVEQGVGGLCAAIVFVFFRELKRVKA